MLLRARIEGIDKALTLPKGEGTKNNSSFQPKNWADKGFALSKGDTLGFPGPHKFSFIRRGLRIGLG